MGLCAGFGKALRSEYGAKLDDQGRRYLERVRSAAQKMGGLIDDLLGLSRVGREPLRKEPVDLTRLATNVVEELRRREPDRQIAVEVAGGLEAQGDAHLLTIALANLLGNAWKFTSKRPGAVVAIGRRENGAETAFSVRDNGAGFDMAYAD